MSWSPAGYVDRLADEAIATPFFHVVIPIWPHACSRYYLRGEDGLTWFEIPRDRRSVILGLVRTPLWLAATIFGAGAIGTLRWELIAACGVVAAIASVLTFVSGRLSTLERDRRALLQRTTGLGAPPEILPASMRTAQLDRLADAWFATRDTPWQDSIELGVPDEMLIAIAEYDQNRRLLARAHRNVIDAEGN
jgi:hypothetical protein